MAIAGQMIFTWLLITEWYIENIYCDGSTFLLGEIYYLDILNI